MLDTFSQLLFGFEVAFRPHNLVYAFLGCLMGTVVGILPGLGPLAAIALLLPLTYGIGDPASSIIMLGAIVYGAMYGGAITSILLKVPGDFAAVITVIDGHAMTRNGRGGPALTISAISSWVGGTFAILGLTFVGPLIANWALQFGPPEYFALALIGVVLSATLSGGKPLRGLMLAFVGMLFGLIGLDDMAGVPRFTFGEVRLINGVDVVAVVMGLYGVGEILVNLENRKDPKHSIGKVNGLMPSRQEWKEASGSTMRGSLIGFVLGLLPGGGILLSTMVSYIAERRISKTPERFGQGAPAGVAAPEAANNAAATAGFVPLLTLGIPGNVLAAILLAALMIQNVQPGPMMIKEHPDVFWGVIASMYVGNVILLILNLPLVWLWVRLLMVPFWILSGIVIMISAIGAYSIANDFFNVGLLAVSGIVGYIARKANFEMGPFVMAFILANLLDVSFAQSLLMGDGDPMIMLQRPISATLLGLASLYLAVQFILIRRAKAEKIVDTVPSMD